MNCFICGAMYQDVVAQVRKLVGRKVSSGRVEVLSVLRLVRGVAFYSQTYQPFFCLLPSQERKEQRFAGVGKGSSQASGLHDSYQSSYGRKSEDWNFTFNI